MATDIHLMCAADLHLGRQVGVRAHSDPVPYVIQAWERLIDLCLETHPPVDVLLLAGDLIDKEGLFIEMHGVLRRGIARLAARNISVIAIAGNHDAKVLDQFNHAFHLPTFHLLGTSGSWERLSIPCKGRTLHVDGLSFTEACMLHNPLAHTEWEAPTGTDVLVGLLHCDVDVPTSKYAPVRTSDFSGLPHHAWILGHVHNGRGVCAARPWVHYCGSLQGLDIGSSECGPRGAWRLIIDSYGAVTSQLIPLAPLRWEQACIDCAQLPSENWEGELIHKIEEGVATLVGEGEYVKQVGVRLQLEGRTPLYRELRHHLLRLQQQEGAGVTVQGRWIPYFIESLKNNTRPEFDLSALAEGRNVVATLAKKILQIQQSPQLADAAYVQLRAKLSCDPTLKRLEQAHLWPSQEECRELYLGQAYALLDELLEQAHA